MDMQTIATLVWIIALIVCAAATAIAMGAIAINLARGQRKQIWFLVTMGLLTMVGVLLSLSYLLRH
jgi:hypothetical protein